MQFETFDAGVRDISVRNSIEMMALICYIFDTFRIPLNLDDLRDCLLETEIVNYYSYSEVIAQIIRSKQIVPLGEENHYVIADKGHETLQNFASTIPASVKTHSINALTKKLYDRQKPASNILQFTPNNTGFDACITVKNDEMLMMRLQVYLPSQVVCDQVERLHKDGPDRLCGKVFNYATSQIINPPPTINPTENILSEVVQTETALETTIKLQENGRILLSLTLYMPTQNSSDIFTNFFYHEPYQFYNKIISIITAPPRLKESDFIL